MATLKLTFPTVVFESIDVEIDDLNAEKLLYEANLEEKAAFIEEQNEKRALPDLTWQKLIFDAMDAGYASIKQVN
jgi:hypothetical protein